MKKNYLKEYLKLRPLNHALLRALEARLLSEQKLKRPVLDLGCGDGLFAKITFNDPIDVGLDTSNEALQEAKKTHAYKELKIASNNTLPFPEESFSTVVSNCTLEHIKELDQTLAEVSRVLKPEGRFIFTSTTNYWPQFLFWSGLFSKLRLKPVAGFYRLYFDKVHRHYHYLSLREWESKLTQVGLRTIDHQYYFSKEALSIFDVSHFLVYPALIFKGIFGKEVLFPQKFDLIPIDKWLWKYYTEIPKKGACVLFIVEKSKETS